MNDKSQLISDLLRPLLMLLHDESFKKIVARLKGYDPSPMGTVASED